MANLEKLHDKNFAGWPQVVEVWHFDRSKGSTNIGTRKKTKPCQVSSVFIALKELLPNKLDIKDGEYIDEKLIPFSILPQNFCKKDVKTGFQKQLRCQACKCLMESTNALKAHLQSQKHNDNFDAYHKQDTSVYSTHVDVINNSNSAIGIPTDQNFSVLGTLTNKRKNDKITVSEHKRRKLETKGEKNKRITDRPGFGQDKYDETSYYFDLEKRLRKVYPYYFTFTTFTKGRWVGEAILDVFSREFRAHSSEEYKRCIESGKLKVNGEKVDIDYKLQHNDMLANVVHRHEVPVTSDRIQILHMDEHLVVIDKPPSIPVHPCGRYRYNTIAYILAKEHGLRFLKTIHRLDRLTSGVLMFGKTPKKAHEMEQQIRARNVQKIYLCRVEGEFPYSSGKDEKDKITSNVITCKMPIEVVSHKIGVCRVSAQGKPCHTEFERLSYDGKNSVVLCRPRTGRMHQIRVHLQYLGYPIINDPLYNSDVFGPNKGKGGDIGSKTYDELIQELIRLHSAENWVEFETSQHKESIRPTTKNGDAQLMNTCNKKTTPDIIRELDHGNMEHNDVQLNRINNCSNAMSTESFDGMTTVEPIDDNVSDVNPKRSLEHILETDEEINCEKECLIVNENETVITEKQPTLQRNKITIDENCKECTMNYSDPTQEQLIMYLHAYKYSGDGWSFETKIPKWAGENIESTKLDKKEPP